MDINAIGLVAGIVAATAAGFAVTVPAREATGRAVLPPAATIVLPPGSFDHPQPGEFLFTDGRIAPAPHMRVDIRRPVEIMRFQVSAGEYGRCVAAGACAAADGRGPADAPVTGVSHIDAEAYAAWYSQATGEQWRLPTDAEWAYAAAEKFTADVEPVVDDPANPARAWLSSYQREVALGRKADPEPRRRGSFGENSRGIADMSGNVWEWTSTCYVRTILSADTGAVASRIDNCGVHVVEGFHRTYMSDFVRDGKSGGCAVGLPPDNLGFRLVREKQGLAERILRLF